MFDVLVKGFFNHATLGLVLRKTFHVEKRKSANADCSQHKETEREWNLRLFLEKEKLSKSQTFSFFRPNLKKKTSLKD